MLSLQRSITSAALALEIVSKHYLGKKPLVQRQLAFDFLPQFPTWFCNAGHTSAKVRFLHKRRARGATETVAACAYCGKSDFTPLATQERSGLPTSVLLCRDCALVFTNPRLSSEFLSDHYRKDYRDIERGERSDLHEFLFDLQGSKGPRLWKFLEGGKGFRMEAGMAIADIGCGEGGLLRWFSQNTRATKRVGFELNLAAAAYGRSLGLDILATEFTGSEGPFDLVMLEQVLEHISSPNELLGRIAVSQKPGAWLYIGVPGILNFAEHYDHNFIAYLQYGHMFHYCLYTLERLVIPFGYRLVSGDETVYALFQRVHEAPSAPSTEPVTADAVVELLKSSEEIFQRRGDHLRNYWADYKPYMKLMYESWLQSCTKETP
jgi:2-polyprenyl-3-methyl-5-hydroxy-6-metoxy-1,4-benzoquinol methylase